MAKWFSSDNFATFWANLKTKLAGKVDKVEGKGLSANDYTDAEKTKLAGVATGANKYTHPTGDGNAHVPATGTTNDGKFLRAGATAGSAAWAGLEKADVTGALGYTPPTTNTTYGPMTGATASAAGTQGLVPAPAAGKQGQYLKGDGTWGTPTNTTYSAMTGATADAAGKQGLVPAPAAGTQGKYLRGDGTWSTPNTTYGVATSSTNGLMASADKAKLDGFGAASTYALKSDIANVYKWKGSKATVSALPATGNVTGDVWNVEADGMNYGWTGSAWDALGSTIEIEAMTAAEIDAIMNS